MSSEASTMLAALQAKAMETQEATQLGTTLVAALAQGFPQASWVGLYWLRGQTLVLGPFVGPETEHTRIPVGRGVCGTAISSDEDQLIQDVRETEHYLACAPDVRSELVVLIRSCGEVVGQFDLDANEAGAFNADDLCVVRTLADAFGGLVAPTPYEADVEDGSPQDRDSPLP